jgi:pimeloyl-ACP methyl ester carboxylesterase
VLECNAGAWLRIAEEASTDHEDLYAGRLRDLALPLLFLHGARDPRTEPGELDALRAALSPAAQFAVLDAGGHSPHSERATTDEVTRMAQKFVAGQLFSNGAGVPGLRSLR